MLGAHTIIPSKNIHKVTKRDYVWFEFLWIRRYLHFIVEKAISPTENLHCTIHFVLIFVKSLTTTYLKQSIDVKNLRRTFFSLSFANYASIECYSSTKLPISYETIRTKTPLSSKGTVFAIQYSKEIALANSHGK